LLKEIVLKASQPAISTDFYALLSVLFLGITICRTGS